jgi:hypothetical protein
LPQIHADGISVAIFMIRVDVKKLEGLRRAGFYDRPNRLLGLHKRDRAVWPEAALAHNDKGRNRMRFRPFFYPPGQAG